MRAIVFLGAKRSGSVREAITAAAQGLGLYTVIITDRKSLIRDRNEFPDIYKMIYTEEWNVTSLTRVIQSLGTEGIQIEAIVSLVDPLVSVATALAERFCNNHLTLSAIEMMEDKIKTRSALESTHFNPIFKICYPDKSTYSVIDSMVERLPVVIKVPDSTGSKGVRRALNRKQFESRLSSFRSRFPEKELLIEEYLKGPQYLVEVLVEKGIITPVAIIRQHTLNRNGFMVIDGYAVLVDSSDEFKNDIMPAVEAIVRTLGMETGTCHLELRRAPNGEWKLIEINPRISGGAMNRMIQIAYGINYVEEILKLILGEKLSVTPRHKHHVYTKFVTSSDSGILVRVQGKLSARNTPGVEEVFINCKKGQRINRTESMRHRYAYVIAADEHSLDVATDAAFLAAEQIQLMLESE